MANNRLDIVGDDFAKVDHEKLIHVCESILLL